LFYLLTVSDFAFLEYIEIWKLTINATFCDVKVERQRRRLFVLKVRAYPTLLLASIGFMDCITTVIGILYFGAVEYNPLLSGIVNTNIGAFIVLKLTTTAFVCSIFALAEKILLKTPNKENKSFYRAYSLLKFAYAGTIIFLAITVINNFLVLSKFI
jgi:hypothetical protein